jgi:hypothetical protein
MTATDPGPDLITKYQKLATEYAKIRLAKHSMFYWINEQIYVQGTNVSSQERVGG